ncbi:MAG: hypothetical protein WC859_02295 [Elusimicrobiota bacterium]|jgi:hypothetical protein
MDNKNEEMFVFNRFAFDDFTEALRAVRVSKVLENVEAKSFLVRYSVIAYCRPFTKCRGKIENTIRLDESYVPPEHLPFHRQLLDLRDQLIAHTDLKVLDPKLYGWKTKVGPMYPIGFKPPDPKEVLKQVDSLEAIFSSVMDEAHRRITAMEKSLPLDG